MRQAYDGFRAMGVDPLFDADLVSAVCFNHTDPFWGDLDGICLLYTSKVDFVSPAGGRLMNITEVADPAFSSKMLGDGFAVDLTDGEIGAPFDGEVTRCV